MDEVLDAVELVADAGLEGAIVWLLRLIGLFALVVGLGLWLFTKTGFLVLPAALLVVGVLLVVLPGLLLELLELAG
ncbi:MAG: hypothetical protein ABEK02_05730 [Haloquadratum sp.]